MVSVATFAVFGGLNQSINYEYIIMLTVLDISSNIIGETAEYVTLTVLVMFDLNTILYIQISFLQND